MELWQIAIPVADRADTRRLLELLRALRVPMDPCAGDPRFVSDATGARRLLLIVTARHQEQLREAGRDFEVVRDLADVPDPIRYVSPGNRYADALARLRARKGRR
jgi:hypothetical protein